MSNISRFLFLGVLVLSLAISQWSCDEIEGNPLEDSVPAPFNGRKVLLEEFTGHQCAQCPEGSERLFSIHKRYPEGTILLSIHAGFFARVDKDLWKEDFRSEIGNEYFKLFNPSFNPSALVNRVDHQIGTSVKNQLDWLSVSDRLLRAKPDISIKLSPSYDSSSRSVTVGTEVTYLKNGGQDYHIVLLLTEDSIVAPQYDIRLKNESGVDSNYVHRHVLRAGITPAFGEQISTTEMRERSVFTKTYTYKIPDGKQWKPDHCHVVAFVHRNGTTYEIIQAEEARLIPEKGN